MLFAVSVPGGPCMPPSDASAATLDSSDFPYVCLMCRESYRWGASIAGGESVSERTHTHNVSIVIVIIVILHVLIIPEQIVE